MNKSHLLFIDACVRPESRTRQLAEYLLKEIESADSCDIERLTLDANTLPVLTEEALSARSARCAALDFSDPYFDLAKQFAAADIIVIAAPFWDLSFPAVLKQYFENISISNLTFRYTEDGFPVGLCRAKELYYVTTAGGPIFDASFGFGYVKALCSMMFGVKRCRLIALENLDIIGNDAEEMLKHACLSLPAALQDSGDVFFDRTAPGEAQ